MGSGDLARWLPSRTASVCEEERFVRVTLVTALSSGWSALPGEIGTRTHTNPRVHNLDWLWRLARHSICLPQGKKKATPARRAPPSLGRKRPSKQQPGEAAGLLRRTN